MKVRWGWTWPGSSGLGWSAAPAIGGSVSSRLSAPVRQVIDQRQRVPARSLTIYVYLLDIFCTKYQILEKGKRASVYMNKLAMAIVQ